jgi:hypothetical protein
MSPRLPAVLVAAVLLVVPGYSKNKKKQTLPDQVLKAQTVLVVIQPDAGEPLTDPTANRTAQESVERAMMKWGRLKLVQEVQTADLVVAVRKGHSPGPTIRNSPADNRPVIIQPGGEGDTRIGVHQGRPPDVTDPASESPADRGPQVSNEIGSTDDTFEVYLGGVQYPLDGPPLWRYAAKDALKAPRVDAVEQFRKAIDESEKQRQKKP